MPPSGVAKRRDIMSLSKQLDRIEIYCVPWLDHAAYLSMVEPRNARLSRAVNMLVCTHTTRILLQSLQSLVGMLNPAVYLTVIKFRVNIFAESLPAASLLPDSSILA